MVRLRLSPLTRLTRVKSTAHKMRSVLVRPNLTKPLVDVAGALPSDSERVQQFGGVVADIAHVFADLAGFHLVGGINGRVRGVGIAGEPAVEVARVEDDRHAVVDRRYVELDLDVKHNEKSTTFSVEVNLRHLK